ncbi:hypothetical protein FSP39_011468 [Pinctada imbricata]|uniref:Uncharacterized protein n=1 Tax=Pinctada imbricata TaxID=66713 RepID=A0AA89C369_PINIB|nr:hypothetical protein FSP39_011468 [Pinctada imbricata]
MPASDTSTVRFMAYKSISDVPTKTSQSMAVKMRLPKRHPVPGTEPPVTDREEEPRPEIITKEGDMYQLRWPPYTHDDVEKKIKTILEPLSLFTSKGDDEDEGPRVELERPVTPINEEIRQQPTSFEHMSKYVRRRIKAKPDVPYLSTEDQQNLAGILMGEINLIWPEIRKQIDDPFLSPEQNKELNRRIVVHVVTVCEQLFNHYLKKAQVLNERGIFSGPANMSRLKAQLALDANKFLNVLTIRRYIVADIRGRDQDEDKDEVMYIDAPKEKPKKRKSEMPVLSFKGMIQTSRPKSKTKKFKYHTPEQEARSIQESFPTLDTTQLVGLLTDFMERVEEPKEDTGRRKAASPDHTHLHAPLSEEDILRRKIILKRSRSLPDIQFGETLLEELNIDPAVKRDKLEEYELQVLQSQIVAMKKAAELDVKKEFSKVPKPGTREYASQDLQNLLAKSKESQDKKIEEDLPPLLQAITRSAMHDGMREKIEKKIKELEEKEKRDKEAQTIKIREPTHPQPATVNAKLPGMVVRASDVRVSERVCMSSITIDRYTTVYNDITGEIDPATVKNLDKNLFLSEEIKEVYREIMKTVPTDHLKLDDDEMVLPAANSVNLSGTMASSSLNKRRSERVINPRLEQGKKPPWGEDDPKQWVRTPHNPPKNFLGEDAFAPTETDFMGVVFHFYDSGDEDEEEDEPTPRGGLTFPGSRLSPQKSYSRAGPTTKAAEMKEREKKIEELKKVKNKFEEGMWNVNTVLMGGLGRDPVVEDDDDASSKRQKSADTAKSAKTLHERAAQRHSAKMDKTRDLQQSRASKVTSVTGTLSKLETDRSEEGTIETQLSPQERLEKVWTALEMPDQLKLDMAIKYSSNEYYIKLYEAIDRWERATDLILKREEFLGKLERFEREASDPNRFFEKGGRGSAVKRLKEAKTRSFFYKRIEHFDMEIKIELDYIKKHFHDEITYKGRPYEEKIKFDRIEMLYWLQEERKQNAMKYEAMMKQLPMNMSQAELDPIPNMREQTVA